MSIIITNFILDYIFIVAGFIAAFAIRFHQSSLTHETLPRNYPAIIILSAIYVLCLAATGGYKKRFNSKFIILQKTLLGLSLGVYAAITFLYIFRLKFGYMPSSIFAISFPIIFLPLVTTKILLYKFSGKIYRKVIFIEEDNFKDLPNQINKDLDEIVLATRALPIEHLYLLLTLTSEKNIKLSILPELYDDIVSTKIKDKTKEHLILPVYFKNRPMEWLIRTSDVAIASTIILITLPLMTVIFIIIKITSKGPAIFKQKRVGLNAREFPLYKFRSMVEGAEQFSRPKEMTLEMDERVTKIGRSLRRWRLDELPQLFNVIKGDMSLVGPRPEAVYRVKEHRALQGIRLSVRPGLTGLAQIEGFYHTTPHHKLKYDYLYIKNRSFRLNINVLMKTTWVIFTKPGS